MANVRSKSISTFPFWASPEPKLISDDLRVRFDVCILTATMRDVTSAGYDLSRTRRLMTIVQRRGMQLAGVFSMSAAPKNFMGRGAAAFCPFPMAHFSVMLAVDVSPRPRQQTLSSRRRATNVTGGLDVTRGPCLY